MTEQVIETRKNGRKTKYTPDTVEKLKLAIGLGATYTLACQYAGISTETFFEWMRSKSDFSDIIKQAEGAAVVGWLAKIEKAANDGSWQAAAWKLERRYWDIYGRQVNLRIDVSKMSDEELEELANGRAPKQLGDGT